MEVYIISKGENHEGSYIIGVYSTIEKAKERAAMINKSICSHEYTFIQEWNVDGREVDIKTQMTDEQRQRWIELNRPFIEMISKNL